MTVILYLIGLPGTGKYTIAKEIAKSNYRIADNQLINNPIFSLLNYTGVEQIPQYAWDAIEHIRTGVFNFIENERKNNYILTNFLGQDADNILFKRVEKLAQNRGSLFVPIKLLISRKENIKRVTNPERRSRYKSITDEDVDARLITIEHPHWLELNITNLSPQEAAEKILNHVKYLFHEKR